MLKRLGEAAAFGLSMVAVVDTVDAMAPFPMQCWPDCNSILENGECQAWFGFYWYYCGWNNGWTYCCY